MSVFFALQTPVSAVPAVVAVVLAILLVLSAEVFRAPQGRAKTGGPAVDGPLPSPGNPRGADNA